MSNEPTQVDCLEAAINAKDAEIAKLKLLVRESFDEGFMEGNSHGMDHSSWCATPHYKDGDEAWLDSDTLKELCPK